MLILEAFWSTTLSASVFMIFPLMKKQGIRAVGGGGHNVLDLGLVNKLNSGISSQM